MTPSSPLPPVPRAQELPAPPHWRTLDFISDLHLQASEPATLAAWQQYLQATPADALFILGDLFEVWVGDDALDEAGSFEAQCAALLLATSQRLPVFFMHGNRDFLVGDRFFQRSGATGLSDPTVLGFGGQRWLLSHGDALCLDDVDYQRFRATVRSAAWQHPFLAQPLPLRRAQARAMRAHSTALQRPAHTYADVDGPAACAWLQAADSTVLLHGHTHRPGDHALAPGLSRSVLSDWELDATPPRAEVLRLHLHLHPPGNGVARCLAQRLSPAQAVQAVQM